MLRKVSDAPKSANAATAEIRSKREEFPLHWVQEENEEEKRYPATRENVECDKPKFPRDPGTREIDGNVVFNCL